MSKEQRQLYWQEVQSLAQQFRGAVLGEQLSLEDKAHDGSLDSFLDGNPWLLTYENALDVLRHTDARYTAEMAYDGADTWTVEQAVRYSAHTCMVEDIRDFLMRRDARIQEWTGCADVAHERHERSLAMERRA